MAVMQYLLAGLVLCGPIAAAARAQAEPNDTCQVASVIGPGHYDNLWTSEYEDFPWPETDIDYDWYRVTVGPGHRLTISSTVVSMDAPGELRLALFIAGGSECTEALVGTWTDSGQRSLTNASAQSRDYYLRVEAFYGLFTHHVNIQYALDVATEIEACPGTVDDRFETGSNAPTPIAPGLHTNLLARVFDDDSYSLQLPQGTAIQVRIDFQNALGDLDLEVADGSNTLTSTGTGDSEIVTFAATQPLDWGPVVVRVHPKVGLNGICNTYALRIDVVQTALGTNYCQAGVNGYTTEARILAYGSSSVSADALRFVCQAFPGLNPGILIASTSQASVPFGDGVRCVGPGILRLGPSSAANAVATYAPTFASGQGLSISAGTTWNYQVFYRDLSLAGGAGFNLTDAVSIAMTP